MDTRKRLPVDIDSFAKVQKQRQYLYVDKTPQIARMLAGDASHVFLARPRRFGKTLLVSTLETLWQGNRKAFQQTWIHDHWDWHSQYPVLRLNMAFRGRHAGHVLHAAIKRRLRILAGNAGPHLFDPDMYADEMLQALLAHWATEHNQEVVVLIDEYDTPITENLDRPDALNDILDVLRLFYGSLKDSLDLTRFVLVTGITRFARVGLFSGANHLQEISFFPYASDLLGFTQQELEDPEGLGGLIPLGAKYLGWSPDRLYRALADHYDGYLFARGGHRVYNPFSLIRCLHDISTPDAVEALPAGHLPNYWSESGSPGLLLRMLETGSGPALTRLAEHPDTVERITYDIRRPDLGALLYQTGYLTRVKAQGPSPVTDWMLDFPNAEVEQTFKDVLVAWQEQQVSWPELPGDETAVLAHAMRDAVRRHAVSALHATFNTFLRSAHHFLHPPPGMPAQTRSQGAWKHLLDYEVHYQALLYAAFTLMGIQTYGELPTVAGRIDLAAVFDDHITIVEIKIDQSAEQAIVQALSGDYPAHFAPRGLPVVVLGFNIDTHTRTVTECAKWVLGPFDLTRGLWQNEPFALPLAQTMALPATDREALPLQEGLVHSRFQDNQEPAAHA